MHLKEAREKSRGEFRFIKRAFEIAGSFIVLIAAILGAQAWMENRIDSAVETKVRSVLSDETILRKIAAESRPSLIFDASGAILQDMGAVQYIKPDDVRVEHANYGGVVVPSRVHIGFVRPVSFAPIVSSLRDPATIVAAHEKGLDWTFDITWTVLTAEGQDTNDSAYVFRLELTP